jgi:hypothetical protein
MEGLNETWNVIGKVHGKVYTTSMGLPSAAGNVFAKTDLGRQSRKLRLCDCMQ